MGLSEQELRPLDTDAKRNSTMAKLSQAHFHHEISFASVHFSILAYRSVDVEIRKTVSHLSNMLKCIPHNGC